MQRASRSGGRTGGVRCSSGIAGLCGSGRGRPEDRTRGHLQGESCGKCWCDSVTGHRPCDGRGSANFQVRCRHFCGAATRSRKIGESVRRARLVARISQQDAFKPFIRRRTSSGVNHSLASPFARGGAWSGMIRTSASIKVTVTSSAHSGRTATEPRTVLAKLVLGWRFDLINDEDLDGIFA